MFCKLLEFLKSFLTWHCEPAYISRDYWMLDSSCKVCYDCDRRFTFFIRKHHCRICGRIFCGNCTAKSMPVPSADPKNGWSGGNRVRVCNFCLKQWQQDVAAAADVIQPDNMDHSSTTSSLVSFRSSVTHKSSSMSVASMSHSNVPYKRLSYGSGPSAIQCGNIDPGPDKQDILMLERDCDSFVDTSDACTNHFSYHLNRNDDEEGYGDSGAQNFQHSSDTYDRTGFYETDQNYDTNKVHHFENIASQEVCSSVPGSTKSQDLECSHKMAEAGVDCSDECGASSSIYGMEAAEEPEDFENNGLLWLPPDPEDEEDELEPVSLNEDDNDATGELGHLRPSKSFGSGEVRTRDRSSDEQRRALKHVVDGHFRALIAQLLEVENIPIGEEDDQESWLEIVTSLSWEAATLLKPDTSKGGGMDPGGYVKVKCIACGSRSQSIVIRGVVCKKNVAHRRMLSKIRKPRFLILGGSLEYQRVMNSLSSFDTLLRQEMDHLKMAVARIDAYKPHVLLVEKSVSRFAQDYLLAKDISLVLNIKRPLLERISRCTGAQIVPSIDHLSSPKLGLCDLFRVEKFLEEHGSAGLGGEKRLKPLMFFEGCPRPLGCTILLKGANGDELKKLKHVVQYGIFAAYHLALETSFLADEGASLPELPLKSPITVALPDKPSGINRSISTIPGFTNNLSDVAVLTAGVNVNNVEGTSKTTKSEMPLHISTLYSGSVSSQMATLYSGSVSSQMAEFSSFSTEPVDSERLLIGNSSQALHAMEPQSTASLSYSSYVGSFSNNVPGQLQKEKTKVCFGESSIAETSFTNDTKEPFEPSVLEDDLKGSDRSCLSSIEGENQLGPYDVLNLYQDTGQLQESTLTKEEFSTSTSDHQSILVSLSSRCVWKGTVCERSHLFRIKYYGSFDKPLGRFLREHLFDQIYCCPSCEMPSEAHIHCYTHQHGSLTISVRKLPEFHLPGERDGKIWMWHRCLCCPRINGFPPATRRIVMSDAAWGLSFGKFLEFSFSNHAAASRVASCGHSLHRDCLRFYGFGKMVACFRYASINVHSVYLPPHKLEFNYAHQEWIQKEADEVDKRKEQLFCELLNCLQRIKDKSTCFESANVAMKNTKFNNYLHELEEMQKKEKEKFEESLTELFKKDVKKGVPFIDILEINKLKRELVFLSYLWDQRLTFSDALEYRPHEFLSSLLSRDRHKFYQVDKLENINVSSKVESSFPSSNNTNSDSITDKTIKHGNYLVAYMDEPFALHNDLNLCQQNLEVDTFEGKHNKTILYTSASEGAQLDPLISGLIGHRALSDGHFPILENLSDTFDAKWTGENGTVLTDLSMLDSSASVDAAAMLTLDDTKEKGVADMIQSLGKSGESAEEFSSWLGLPFHNHYCSFNKSSGNHTPRFEVLNEYNPVYVSLFCELKHQGGARLLLPTGENETVIPVYDDEPTSVISYALVSNDYHVQMSDDRERTRDLIDSSLQSALSAPVNLQLTHSIDELLSETLRSFGSSEESILALSGSRSSLDPLLRTKRMHVRVSFEGEGPLGKVRHTVICYYAKSFDDLRRTCCSSELDYIRSLSRCKKWGAQGGKSNVFFAKSLDDRFIIKQVTKTEIESFIKFAPEYFKYLSDSIATGSPTCLAKILGIYQVSSKHLKGGKETKMDVLVMENLLFGRNVTRLYDLKGSSRSRYNPDSSGNNKVLLDQNLIEAMPTSPIFVGNKAKRLLERAVWNDTSFLASIDVMDYSLLVGIDEMKHELVIGIIDFMRQYTWDKHLETWVKASGILGGSKNSSPTVVSPKTYKKRFRKAMSAYFLVVPDQWSPPAIVPGKLPADIVVDNYKIT